MTILSNEDLSLIARCWIRYHSGPQTKKILRDRLPEPNYRKTLSVDGDVWPYDVDPESFLIDLEFSCPDAVFETVLKIVELTDSEWHLALLAAGPLEDLVKFRDDAKKYLAKYRALAKDNPKLEKVLSFVWF